MPAIAKLFALVLSLIGPHPADTPKDLHLKAGDKIVAIGDSITAGGGYLLDIDAVLAQQYPDLNIPKVVNKGIGGQKAEELIKRFEKDVVQQRPAFVTISIGINDVWHRLKNPHDEKILATFKENVGKMVEAAQKAGITVILLTPTVIQEDANAEGNKRLVKYVEAEKQIVAEKKCQLVDLHAMFLAALKQKPADQKGNWLTSDGVHMKPLGNGIMATGVLRALGVPDAKIAASEPAWPPPAYWQMAPTPPMGWNSYDSFGDGVTEEEILDNARYQKEHLLPHGWNYVVVDYRWYDPGAHDNNPNGRAGAKLEADRFGRLLPAPNRFPLAADGKGFKPLADQIHAMGLKFGIHVMRGIPRQSVKANTPIESSDFKAGDAAKTGSICPWCPDMYGVDADKPAGQAWYDSIVRQYVAWGVDFVKVDDLSSPYSKGEIEAIRRAIDRCGRAIVFSTSPGETPVKEAAHVETHANMWRISGDFWDNWDALNHNFDLLAAWQGHAGPGRWPDADMIPLGHVGKRSVGGNRITLFSKDEQVTMMTLWAIAPSPLMLGMNMPENDQWTLSLLTNDEVLAVNQDPLGGQGIRISQTKELEVWAKDLSGGAKAVAFFNRASVEQLDESRAVFKSPLVTRKTPGQSVVIDADIMGAKKLYLVVDDGGDGFFCDHADWIEPKLTGPQGERKLTSLKWTSATCGWGKVAVGRSASGKDLIVDGKKVADGIGTHAQSIIEYDLPAGCTRFIARGGLDRGGVIQKIGGATVHFLVFTTDPRQTRKSATVSIPLKALGLAGPCRVRDLWARKDAVDAGDSISRNVPAHGAVLLKLQPGSK